MARPRAGEWLDDEITRWRAALRRTVMLAVETGELKADTDPAQVVSEMNGVMMTQLHDARFLRTPGSVERARTGFTRLIENYRT
eukprot:gene13275-13053_t